MIQAAKIIGTGLATTGLILAGVGIGVVLGSLILAVSYLGLVYLLISIVVCAALIFFMSTIFNTYSYFIDILLASIMLVMILLLFLLGLDFICELLTHIKLLKLLLASKQVICMAVPGMPYPGSDSV
jgi:hypothetical protein